MGAVAPRATHTPRPSRTFPVPSPSPSPRTVTLPVTVTSPLAGGTAQSQSQPLTVTSAGAGAAGGVLVYAVSVTAVDEQRALLEIMSLGELRALARQHGKRGDTRAELIQILM